MAKPITKAYEVKFAIALLKDLHANVNNFYLLLAIIAWTRDTSGTSWIGNNPLKINSGKRYSSLTAAAAATARKIMAGTGWYKTLLAAARRTPRAEAAKQTQATDFLTALAFSDWDAKHYGVIKAGPYQGWMLDVDHPEKNRLLPILEHLSHYPVSIPGTPSPPPPPPPVPKPLPPPIKVHDLPTHIRTDYIDPYEAKGFYEARHKPDPIIPGAPLGVA